MSRRSGYPGCRPQVVGCRSSWPGESGGDGVSTAEHDLDIETAALVDGVGQSGYLRVRWPTEPGELLTLFDECHHVMIA